MTIEEKDFCRDCPKHGREGIWRNLKYRGMSYCQECYNIRQREAYRKRKEYAGSEEARIKELELIRERDFQAEMDRLDATYGPPPPESYED